jgi:hypothetical protein
MTSMEPEFTQFADVPVHDVHPRYVDPPVVHLEQVIWCRYHLREVEAVTVINGSALCEPCLYRA